MTSPDYKEQVRLLLDVLPQVAKEECFALHGGTAINLWLMLRFGVLPRIISMILPFSYNHDGGSEIGMPQILDNVPEYAGDRLCFPSCSEDHNRGRQIRYLSSMTSPR